MQKAPTRDRGLCPGTGAWPGVSIGIMSALPVDPTQHEDPLDPGQILRALPDRERETFLAEYRRAVDDARDPARWPELRRVPRVGGRGGGARGGPGGLGKRGGGEAG